MKIRYLGGRSLSVLGSATRRTYQFSGTVREQIVDPRDAISMVKPGMFQFVELIEVQSEEKHHG